MAQPSYACPRCSAAVTWVAQYAKWYCYSCSSYPFDAPATASAASPQTAATTAPVNTAPAAVSVPKCATCQGSLTYVEQYKAWYCNNCRKYAAVADPKHAMAKCPTCGSQLTYSTDQQRWYCYTCRKYVGEGPQAPNTETKGEAADLSASTAKEGPVTVTSGGGGTSPVQVTIINSPSASLGVPPPTTTSTAPDAAPAEGSAPTADPGPEEIPAEAALAGPEERELVAGTGPAEVPTPAGGPTVQTRSSSASRIGAAATAPPAAPPRSGPASVPRPPTSPRSTAATEDFILGELKRSKVPRREDPPAPAARAPELRKETLIEDVFLLYNDGRLIRHYTRRLKPTVDSEILSSMLVAVSAFVKDSRISEEEGEGAGLDEIKYGALRIHLARGRYLTVAMLIQGDDAEGVVGRARGKIREIETMHEPVVKDWDGKMSVMQPVHKHIEDLFG